MSFAVCGVILTTAPATLGQGPIRVETNQVLVPVFVEDEARVSSLETGSETLYRAIMAGDTKRVDAILEWTVIRNLSAADFQILEDGKVQTIQNVAYERSLYWDVRDNRGHHTEYLGPGGGKWSTTEWAPEVLGDADPPHYVLAYAPPESPEGSCHRIQVRVDRRKALVAARNEYCNIHHPASDPLSGSKLGEQLEGDLARPTKKSVAISLLAIPFYTNGEVARVYIAVDWPWKSLKGEPRSRGTLGMVYKKDGSLVTRFSDVADREGISGAARWGLPHSSYSDPTENRYDRQLNLPPGEYELRVAISDGRKFGRAVVPLTVESYEGKELAVSQVSLCKQISDASANAQKLPGAWTAKLPDGYSPLVSNETEFKPTGDTRFKSGESLYTYFEVYAPFREGEPPAAVEAQIRIVDLNTGKLISDPEPISATPYLKAGSPTIPIGRGIDISKVPKGSYRLEVQAADSNGKRTDWRFANFSVQ